jgi:hypothetical protein
VSLFGALTGWDKTIAAVNAVMGNYLMENSDVPTKIMITNEITNIISIVRYGKVSKETILSELSKDSRVIQMNFVALACDNLGIPPPFKNTCWERIKNPYAVGSQVEEIRIESAISSIQRDDPRKISWPGISTPFDFEALLELDRKPHQLYRPEPIRWINPEDYDLFGYDLMNLLDRIFNDVHNGLFNKSAEALITYEDFDAFGQDLISTIIKITLQTIFQHQSNNQFINKAIKKSTNYDIETFGEDLIDLIWRSALQNIESKKSA